MTSASTDSEFLEFELLVRPGSRRGTAFGRHGDAYALAVSARAVEGAANAAVVTELARILGVRKSAVEVISGLRSRHKRIRVRGNPSVLRVGLETAAGSGDPAGAG
jgi:uncharacterized protein (TIGR00251 family)